MNMGSTKNGSSNDSNSMTGSGMGAMGLFFNFKTSDFYILFQFWYVDDIGIFIASIFIVGFTAFANEVLAIHIDTICKKCKEYDHFVGPVLQFVRLFVNGLLMLMMMSFNGTILIVILLGKIFAHIIFPEYKHLLVECHE